MLSPSIIIVSVLATFAAAIPTPAPASAATEIQALQDSAANTIHTLKASGCAVKKCIASVATLTAACGAAAAEDGLNPFADAFCFASVASYGANEACDGCF